MPDVKNIEAALDLSKDESKVLGLKLGGKTIARGQTIPKADAKTAPELSFDAPPGTYVAVNLDLDAPFPSFAFMSPILHWVQSGLTPSKAADGTTTLSAGDLRAIAPYIGPGPPPPSAPHRYVFLLYEQPAGFDIEKLAPGDKPMSRMSRMRCDYDAFVKQANLGPVIASTYFLSN